MPSPNTEQPWRNIGYKLRARIASALHEVHPLDRLEASEAIRLFATAAHEAGGARIARPMAIRPAGSPLAAMSTPCHLALKDRSDWELPATWRLISRRAPMTN